MTTEHWSSFLERETLVSTDAAQVMLLDETNPSPGNRNQRTPIQNFLMADQASSTNEVNKLVKRDEYGDFHAAEVYFDGVILNDATGGRLLYTASGAAPNPGMITESSVTAAEAAYLSGVESNIQTQLDSKITCTSGTQAAITATTPSGIQFGFATDTKQLLFYNTDSWVICA